MRDCVGALSGPHDGMLIAAVLGRATRFFASPLPSVRCGAMTSLGATHNCGSMSGELSVELEHKSSALPYISQSLAY